MWSKPPWQKKDFAEQGPKKGRMSLEIIAGYLSKTTGGGGRGGGRLVTVVLFSSGISERPVGFRAYPVYPVCFSSVCCPCTGSVEVRCHAGM